MPKIIFSGTNSIIILKIARSPFAMQIPGDSESFYP
jgi:hypothetical protein